MCLEAWDFKQMTDVESTPGSESDQSVLERLCDKTHLEATMTDVQPFRSITDAVMTSLPNTCTAEVDQMSAGPSYLGSFASMSRCVVSLVASYNEVRSQSKSFCDDFGTVEIHWAYASAVLALGLDSILFESCSVHVVPCSCVDKGLSAEVFSQRV